MMAARTRRPDEYTHTAVNTGKMTEWPREQTVLLIDVYRSHPVLWVPRKDVAVTVTAASTIVDGVVPDVYRHTVLQLHLPPIQHPHRPTT